jgi:hypothetical protein
LSDGTTRRRVTSGQTSRRRKGGSRGGRHGLSRPSVATASNEFVIEQRVPSVGPVQARRTTATAPHPVGITREAEFAYIRSDMRRLIVIGGVLLALMLLLLILVNR